MPDPEPSTMRSLGRFFGRVRAGFLGGLRGEPADPDRGPASRAETPVSPDDTAPRRVVARRTTVVEELHIIEEERR